ncbi:hypothetical protein NHQ30_000697 [Ciborinia camelliae]|nr:hypothetical protein NHQ30_000697 [Ciborinia camelliae]
MANVYLDTDEEEYEGGSESDVVLIEGELEQNDSEATGDADNDEDEIEDGDREPNPGEEIINVGKKHKGKTFDEVIQTDKNYIHWAVKEYEREPDNASEMIRTLKSLYDRKKAWTEKKEAKIPPGSIPIWFGKHEGVLFKDLEDSYVYWALNECARGTASANLHKFKDLYNRYNDWLDRKHNRSKKSPGSIAIWFGEDKGREFRQVRNQPRKWRWLITPGNCRWRPRLLEIDRQYQKWLEGHRRKPSQYRKRPEIVNPRGERLGREDDGAASDVGSYVSDDGFVVADEDEASDDDEGEDTESDTEIFEENESHVDRRGEDNKELDASSDSETVESDTDSLPNLEDQGSNAKESESDVPSAFPSRGKPMNETPKSKVQEKYNSDSSDSDRPLTLPRRKASGKRARSTESTDSDAILTSPTRQKTRKQTQGKT